MKKFEVGLMVGLLVAGQGLMAEKNPLQAAVTQKSKTISEENKLEFSGFSVKSGETKPCVCEKVGIHVAGTLAGAAAGFTGAGVATAAFILPQLYMSPQPGDGGAAFVVIAYSFLGALAGGVYGAYYAQEGYDYLWSKNEENVQK